MKVLLLGLLTLVSMSSFAQTREVLFSGESILIGGVRVSCEGGPSVPSSSIERISLAISPTEFDCFQLAQLMSSLRNAKSDVRLNASCNLNHLNVTIRNLLPRQSVNLSGSMFPTQAQNLQKVVSRMYNDNIDMFLEIKPKPGSSSYDVRLEINRN